MNTHNTINYLEFPVKDIEKTKLFFGQVFGWEFIDYGPEYICFTNAGITGGFYLSDQSFNLESGCVLVVLYSQVLEESLEIVTHHGGIISKAIFTFSGGRRFHFKDPSGNEFAVWSE
jgi:predicted enzyme related to lactoylglutathione lyase